MHSAVTIVGYSVGPVQADHSTDDPDNWLESAMRIYARETVHIHMHACTHVLEKQLECYSELKINVIQVLCQRSYNRVGGVGIREIQVHKNNLFSF